LFSYSFLSFDPVASFEEKKITFKKYLILK